MKRSTVIIVLALLAMLAASVPVLADPPPVVGVVTRYSSPVVWAFCDGEQELCILAGGDFQEFCSDPGSFAFDRQYFQDVLASGKDPKTIELGKGALFTSVWPADPFLDCAYALTHGPVASGIANVTNNDNDLWWNGHTSSWGVRMRGTLETPDGEPVHLNFHYRIVTKIAPPWTPTNETIKLELH